MKKVVIKVETSQIPVVDSDSILSQKSSTRPFSPSQIPIVDSDSILSHPRPKNSSVLNKYMLEK